MTFIYGILVVYYLNIVLYGIIATVDECEMEITLNDAHIVQCSKNHTILYNDCHS
jgi:hypothetical protein